MNKERAYVKYYERPGFIEVIPTVHLNKPMVAGPTLRIIEFKSISRALSYIRAMTYEKIKVRVIA